jgi:hypothetical protein
MKLALLKKYVVPARPSYFILVEYEGPKKVFYGGDTRQSDGPWLLL